MHWIVAYLIGFCKKGVGSFLLVVSVFLGYFFAFMWKQLIQPETPEDVEAVEEFSYFDMVEESAWLVTAGLVCGVAGSKLLDWGWSWLTALYSFATGVAFLLMSEVYYLQHNSSGDSEL